MTVLPPIDRSTQIGRSVGWRLAFPEIGLTIGHATHYARIEASMPGGLDGGAFRIEIEALNVADFRLLAMARRPQGDALERPLVKAELTLFWRDRVGDEPPAARAPVTAVIAVTGLARLAEGLRVKTVIDGRDWLFARLERARFSAGQSVQGLIGALAAVLDDAGLGREEYVLHPPADTEQGEGFEIEGGTPVLDILERIGERIAERTGHRGRSLFLLREGVLHAGADRPIPFAPTPGARGAVYAMTPDEGLVRAENQGERRLTTAELRREVETGAAVTARDAYLLTIAGRPDLKPGDVVEIAVEGAEAAEFGGFGLPPLAGGPGGGMRREVYVNSVQHRLGKNRGWVTTATGVTVDAASQPSGVWDIVEVAEAGAGSAAGGDRDAADPAEAIVHHIRHEARTAMRTRERPRVGEVRANHQRTEMTGAAVAAAAQSLDLMVGLAPPDGQPRRARRQEVRRTEELRRNVPYLTPFAWGPFGLVLPHYPGERVLVSFHEDSIDDPVVMGSFWQTADGSAASAPQNVQAGDWWLILPADIASGARTTATGADPAPPPGDARAVHDLIDATGARVVQMKELTIRTLPADSLGAAATRPEAGADGGVLITHNNGARIHIASNGAITIEATEGLKLKAGGDVEIEGANIKLKGGSVDVVS